MLVCNDSGVDLERLRAIRTWMSLDDLADAIELRQHQQSWEHAARENAERKSPS